jgi:hypothetical protein
MIITIRPLEDDTCKTHLCLIEFKFVAVEGTANCPVTAFLGWRSKSIRLRGGSPESVCSFSVDVARQTFQHTAAVRS